MLLVERITHATFSTNQKKLNTNCNFLARVFPRWLVRCAVYISRDWFVWLLSQWLTLSWKPLYFHFFFKPCLRLEETKPVIISRKIKGNHPLTLASDALFQKCIYIFSFSMQSKRRTKTAMKSTNPKWNQTFVYPCRPQKVMFLYFYDVFIPGQHMIDFL